MKTKKYATYDSVHGVYESVRVTHRFFCGVYGAVRGIFSVVRGVFRISVNSATLASERCHYCKAKQTILTSKTGTIPVQKWHYSDVAEALCFSSALRSARCRRNIWIK